MCAELCVHEYDSRNYFCVYSYARGAMEAEWGADLFEISMRWRTNHVTRAAAAAAAAVAEVYFFFYSVSPIRFLSTFSRSFVNVVMPLHA